MTFTFHAIAAVIDDHLELLYEVPVTDYCHLGRNCKSRSGDWIFLVSIFTQEGRGQAQSQPSFLPPTMKASSTTFTAFFLHYVPTYKACFDMGLASRKRSPLKIESVMDLAFSKTPSFHWSLAYLPRSLTLPPSPMPSITDISALQAKISKYSFSHWEKRADRLRGKPVAGATGAIHKD